LFFIIISPIIQFKYEYHLTEKISTILKKATIRKESLDYTSVFAPGTSGSEMFILVFIVVMFLCCAFPQYFYQLLDVF